MAVLTTGQRDRMPQGEFALPGGRFPINDRIHAEKALQLAPRSEAAGNISPGQVQAIRAKVKSRYGIGGGAESGESMRDRLAKKMSGE